MPDHATWLEQLMPTTWVATLADDVVGYCYVQAFDSVGHFQNIVVAPSMRERGIGRALMETAGAWFRSRGLTAWRLNVRADNTAALALYASFGFPRLYSTKLLRLPWRPRPACRKALTSDAVVPLLDALRQHTPESAHIEVLIEDDARLAAALEDAGASVRLETSVMQAPL